MVLPLILKCAAGMNAIAFLLQMEQRLAQAAQGDSQRAVQVCWMLVENITVQCVRQHVPVCECPTYTLQQEGTSDTKAAAAAAVQASKVAALEKANHELRWQVAMLARPEGLEEGRGPGIRKALSAAGAIESCCMWFVLCRNMWLYVVVERLLGVESTAHY